METVTKLHYSAIVQVRIRENILLNIELIKECAKILVSGAASTHFHTLSPLSESLFQRAIIMSGSALNNWAYNKDSAVGHRAIMSEFAHLYDKIFTNLEDLIKFLQTVDGNVLFKETQFLISNLVKKEITLKWLPVIEGDIKYILLWDIRIFIP